MDTKSKRISRNEYLAIGVLMQHKDWTNEKIAAEIGVHRGTIYRMKEFMKLRAKIREIGLAGMPHGTRVVDRDDPKTPSGMEAWHEESQEDLDGEA